MGPIDCGLECEDFQALKFQVSHVSAMTRIKINII